MFDSSTKTNFLHKKLALTIVEKITTIKKLSRNNLFLIHSNYLVHQNIFYEKIVQSSFKGCTFKESILSVTEDIIILSGEEGKNLIIPSKS